MGVILKFMWLRKDQEWIMSPSSVGIYSGAVELVSVYWFHLKKEIESSLRNVMF
jgi:hypothetical protein